MFCSIVFFILLVHFHCSFSMNLNPHENMKILFGSDYLIYDKTKTDSSSEEHNAILVKRKNVMDLEEPSALPVGHQLYEGDMLLSNETIQQHKDSQARFIIKDVQKLWPDGIVYYFISPSSSDDHLVIQEAMTLWETNTCIKFVEIDPTTFTGNYIYVDKLNGCYSFVGCQGIGQQTLSIGVGCEYVPLVAHELGHAIGLFHHQSRPDRDKFVVVLSQNMNSDKLIQFQVSLEGTTFNLPYDYSSIMHYESTAFSKNGLPTLLPVNVTKEYLLGTRAEISFRDYYIVNTRYKCIDRWNKRCISRFCRNGGYVGSSCQCRCPPGTNGTLCEKITGDYYPSAPEGCGGYYTNGGIFKTPGFQSSHSLLICNYWFHSNNPKLVPQITFNKFNLYGREKTSKICYYELMEIRTSDLYNSTRAYCGKEISPGTQFTSEGPDAVVRMYSYYYGAPTGAEFSVQFVQKNAAMKGNNKAAKQPKLRMSNGQRTKHYKESVTASDPLFSTVQPSPMYEGLPTIIFENIQQEVLPEPSLTRTTPVHSSANEQMNPQKIFPQSFAGGSDEHKAKDRLLTLGPSYSVKNPKNSPESQQGRPDARNCSKPSPGIWKINTTGYQCNFTELDDGMWMWSSLNYPKNISEGLDWDLSIQSSKKIDHFSVVFLDLQMAARSPTSQECEADFIAIWSTSPRRMTIICGSETHPDMYISQSQDLNLHVHIGEDLQSTKFKAIITAKLKGN